MFNHNLDEWIVTLVWSIQYGHKNTLTRCLYPRLHEKQWTSRGGHRWWRNHLEPPGKQCNLSPAFPGIQPFISIRYSNHLDLDTLKVNNWQEWKPVDISVSMQKNFMAKKKINYFFLIICFFVGCRWQSGPCHHWFASRAWEWWFLQDPHHAELSVPVIFWSKELPLQQRWRRGRTRAGKGRCWTQFPNVTAMGQWAWELLINKASNRKWKPFTLHIAVFYL